MSSISLVSLNVERSKHLDLVCPFLKQQQADVVCVQELMQKDCARIAEACNVKDYFFMPMARLVTEMPGEAYGIGIFSRALVVAHGEDHYVRIEGQLPESDPADIDTYNNANRMVVWVDVEKDGIVFRIATTHFTWSPHGESTEKQRTDIQNLCATFGSLGELVLTGDFNAPRGGEIFGILADHLKDNIPAKHVTSLDASLHRAGKTRPQELADKMVDGVFSTPGYTVSNVELIPGISDHCAITATISKSE